MSKLVEEKMQSDMAFNNNKKGAQQVASYTAFDPMFNKFKLEY